MDISIIIVSWNVKEKLRENLKALSQSQGGLEMEVFVIDNKSRDGSARMVEKEFKQVKLIKNKTNIGLSRAVNQVKHRLKSDFILLLNPDNKVFPDTLSNMINWMRENPKVSVASCYLENGAGETVKHVRRWPTVWNQLIIILKLPHFFPKILNRYLRPKFKYEQAQMVNSARGSFFMIRKEIVEKIGLWDERYFLWFEEVDYCRRVYQARGEVWYTPDAKCLDYVGMSFSQTSTLKKQLYFRSSMLKYFRKWHPFWQYLLLWLAWPIGLALALMGEKINFKKKAKT